MGQIDARIRDLKNELRYYKYEHDRLYKYLIYEKVTVGMYRQLEKDNAKLSKQLDEQVTLGEEAHESIKKLKEDKEGLFLGIEGRDEALKALQSELDKANKDLADACEANHNSLNRDLLAKLATTEKRVGEYEKAIEELVVEMENPALRCVCCLSEKYVALRALSSEDREKEDAKR